MAFEMMVGLTVSDDKVYQDYREAMTPLLQEYGGGFRYDFVVSKVLKSASDHAINRVFAIYFKDENAMNDFFANPTYQEIRAKYFEHSVSGTTRFGSYTR